MIPKVCFAIITYQTGRFIRLQVSLIRRFCRDQKIAIVVCDNSRCDDASNQIKSTANKKSIYFTRLLAEKADPSISHGLACSEVLQKFHMDCDYLVLLDHDIFPIKPFFISGLMRRKVLAGRGQIKGIGSDRVYYIWPGFMVIDCNLVDLDKMKFNPGEINGVRVDTGGEIAPYIHTLNEKAVLLPWMEMNCEGFSYDLIWNERFLHIVNGSNWAKENGEDHENRISRMMRFVREKAKEAREG
jgi:hypothetical protein